jgi:hypothetical protein
VVIRVSPRAAGPRTLEAEVTVANLTGHRFPTGVGFRRAFIELLVFDVATGQERLVWASGRTNRLGVLVDGGARAPSDSSGIDHRGRVRHFQPHHRPPRKIKCRSTRS